MRFIRRKKIQKTFAVFFALEMLVNTIAPTISWALTSGPTAPEATSFEPVDTSDVVNLATGDLVYNVPLLEVPGPNGGYPLSLSYHPGIQPNEDASWVGLGWTLNAGSITRNVNGFADDFVNRENSTRAYWKGGESNSYEVGVTLSPTGSGGPSVGLSYSQDTFQGSGIGIEGEVGYGPLTVKTGVDPYGNPYGSAGLRASLPLGKASRFLRASVGIGVQTNFQSVNTYATGGVRNSLMGASMSTTSPNSVTVNAVGVTPIGNSKSGKLSTFSTGFNVAIPVNPALSINLGYTYRRYWIDQVEKTKVNGALSYPTTAVDKAWLNSHAYDTYSLLDISPDLEGGAAENPDPEKLMGGSFPNFDMYSVQTQGLGGFIRPYYFQKHLIKRNQYEIKQDSQGDDYKDYKTVQYQTGFDDLKAEFRFVGDFSNRFEYTPGDMAHYPDANHPFLTNPLSFDFADGDTPVVGEEGTDAYNSNRLPGSRHVEWLTNDEILNTQRPVEVGLMETHSTGFDREAIPSSGIGAFVITNESGVKYHFALPVMNLTEYSYSENKNLEDAFNEHYNKEAYAYTWYLTAITGPDYVDRGPEGTADGIFNEHDWGYWVEVEYGKWTDSYFWRNPSEGMITDLDSDFKNFSEGRKEIYYIDAIRTKSHTALFVKDIRNDAKSVIYAHRNTVGLEGKQRKILSPVTKEGGFTPQQVTNECLVFRHMFTDSDHGTITYTSRPTSSLKLKEIVLVKNEDLAQEPVGKSAGGFELSQNYTYGWTVEENINLCGSECETRCSQCEECDFSSINFNSHLPQNVVDVHDLVGNDIKTKAVRIVEFGTDDSENALSPNTANSFDHNLCRITSPSLDASDYPKMGKLTLNEIRFKGKGGEGFLPPIKLKYDLDNPEEGFDQLDFNLGYHWFSNANSGLEEGDILRMWEGSDEWYGVVMSIQDGLHKIKVIHGLNLGEAAVHWKQTKNPPYSKDLFDMWGLYKSDLDKNLLLSNENAARLVSSLSAKNTDVWSLRSIQTSTGAKFKIKYESDTYVKPALSVNQVLRLSNVQKKSGPSSNYLMTLHDGIDDLDKILKPGDQINFSFLMADPVTIDLPAVPSLTEFASRVETGSTSVIAISKNTEDKWVIETSSFAAIFAERPDEDDLDYHLPRFIAGNLSHANETENYGGGLRVKSISLINGVDEHKTSYHYNQHQVQATSGVTSYEPGGLDQVLFNFPSEGTSGYAYFNNATVVEKARKAYKKELYKNFFNLLANARELPSPGVLYEYVTVEEGINSTNATVTLPKYSTYQFEVFNPGMIGITYEDGDDVEMGDPVFATKGSNVAWYDTIKTRKVELKNFTARVGGLKSITLYNDAGNKISQTVNHYLHDGITSDLITTDNDPLLDDTFEANVEHYEPALATQFNNQGVVHETFSEARFVRQKYDVLVIWTNETFTESKKSNHLLGVVSKREEFPSIKIGQTTTNFVTGARTESKITGFDFYSGQTTKSEITDGYGTKFVQEAIPAYRQYTAMGSAAHGGRNMLTQEGSSFSYRVDPTTNDKLGLVSANVQTWSDDLPAIQQGQTVAQANAQTGIWRKHASFAFVGNDATALNADGFYPVNSVTPFTAWDVGDVTPAGWQKNTEVTLIDVNSHALEVTDVNGQFSSTRYSNDQSLILATAANASYEEFAYSGAEDVPGDENFGGNVEHNSNIYTSSAHTGSKALVAQGNSRGFTFVIPAPKIRSYRVSIWASQTSSIAYKLGSGNTEYADARVLGKAGDWYLIEANIAVPQLGSSLEVWCEAGENQTYFDDFRICPVDAAMTSYVYNSWGELTHILNNNNMYTEYEYDDMGKLKKVNQESFQFSKVKVTEHKYHYANQN